MKIGYPCINLSLKCRSSNTFRLASFSEKLFCQKVEANLSCLLEILKFNLREKLFFLRISSDLIPFASHPQNKIKWQQIFKNELQAIGKFIRREGFRISMHPDQFNVLNSPVENVFKNTQRELQYHADLLDAMELDKTAKIQIHIGGIYQDKSTSLLRFCHRFRSLSQTIRNRLVIENDERLYSLADCLQINQSCSVPVLFDYYHYSLFNHGEDLRTALQLASKTWTTADGILMVDYSSPLKGGKFGQHALSIDLKDFSYFIKESSDFDFDLMLEIKDKERSALLARDFLLQSDNKLN